MKRFLSIMILAVIFAGRLPAQNVGDIKGQIFSDNPRETLPGALVMVKYGNQVFAASTDGQGRFTLKAVPTGVYTLTVSSMSYHRQYVYPVNVVPDKIAFIPDIYLVDSALMIDGGVISGDPIIDKEGPSKMTILPAIIENVAGNRDLTKIISTMIPGAYSTEDGEIYFRGSRSGDAIYIVDGVKVMDGRLNIPGGAIGSMNVYTGGTPARYGDFTGACIVIETKSYFSWLNEQQAMNSH